MTVDLAELLAQEQDRLVQDWASDELAASAVTGALGRVTRDVDIRCPVDGGVVAVILTESTIEAARVVAERVRTAVEAGEVHREQTLVVSGVTVSIGWSPSRSTVSTRRPSLRPHATRSPRPAAWDRTRSW